MRNGAEQAVYRIEKLLKDEGDKLAEDVVAPVKSAVDDLKKALEGEDLEAIKQAMTALEEKSQAIGQALYAQAAEAQAAPAADGAKPAEDDDTIIDAEVIDEEENK